MKPGETVKWLNAEAAAEYLGIRTMNAFYVFLHKERSRKNGLRIHRLHGRLRFRIADLERCIEQEPDVAAITEAPLLRGIAGGRR